MRVNFTFLPFMRRRERLMKPEIASIAIAPTLYLKQTVVNAQSKQIQITTTNSNYTPVGQ